MTDWTDTAKRLAAHPRWREGPARDGTIWGTDEPGIFRHAKTGILMDAYRVPILTDWPTVGVLLGMVVEAARERGGGNTISLEIPDYFPQGPGLGEMYSHVGPVRRQAYKPITDSHNAEYPGQALGELLLELWGEA